MGKEAKEQLDKAIVQAEEAVEKEVEDHKLDEADLEGVSGGWKISYETGAEH